MVEADQELKGLVHVRLNRPSKLNALDMEMFDEICSAAKRLKNDRSIRVVIVSGNGKGFCSGLDVLKVASNPLNIKRLLEKPAGSPITNMGKK